MNDPRFLVVSDLHLTSGKNPESGVWSPTEDFFWDDEFRDFLAHYSASGSTTLIINGDLFDFLKVLVFPTAEEMRSYGISPADINRTYGLRCTEATGAFQIDKIADGHPVFFRALADFIVAGNSIVILKGNHDVQLFWNAVRERVYARLEDFVPPQEKRLVRERLTFLPWCYYVPELLYVEHGNQYEYTTSFRNFLNPELPIDYPGTGKQIELDLSGFLVRYVLNRLKPIDPLSDSIRPQSKYFETFWKAHPFLFITTIGTTLRFILKAFAKARELSSGSFEAKYRGIVDENNARIREEAKRFAEGPGDAAASLEKKFRQFDARKAEPVLTSGAWRFLWMELKTPLAALLAVLPLYVLSFVPNLNELAGDAISRWAPSIWKSALLGLIALKVPQLAAVALLGLLMIVFYGRIRKKKRKPSGKNLDITMKVRRDAAFIARELGVPYVTFGHTHYADVYRCADRQWYFNTGTWMTIFSPEEQIYRDAHQFTFLKVENEGAELLRWNPDRKAPQPVHVVDTDPAPTDVEDGIFKVLLGLFGRA
jgi:UDP-2,3-diacylglucosamine pyrophosphatase LpxH